jgi:SusD/RagB-like outer membrane lipoprotein
MRHIKNIALAAMGSILIFSCNKKIESLQTNPNNPTTVPPSLILGTVLTDMSGTVTNASATGYNAGSMIGNLGGTASWDAVHRWNQYYCVNYNYYNVNNYSWQNGPFDSYQVLNNVVQMEKEAITRGAAAVNPYTAIGKFVRAFYYYNMTSLMGDIPQANALEGTANPAPSYTPQKQVFQYVLNVLDTANTQLAALIAASDNTLMATASQDIYYGGVLTQWQKAVNSFKLRVLVSLSLQASDPDLKVGQQFANIINNPTTYPIFQSQADDLQFVYKASYNLYYFSPAVYGSIAARYNMAQTYVQALTNINDARVYVTSEPAWKLVDSLGYAPTDFRAFVGSSTGEGMDKMLVEAERGIYSYINRKRYFDTYVGEPDVLVGYKEMCFNIAEAINRGWIGGSAESWYKTGMTESFKFYGLDPAQTSFTAYFQLPSQGTIGSYTAFPFTFDFNTYYSQPAVQYAGGQTGLNQIALQKYLAMFQNSGWEAYFNHRRTGIPAFQGGVGVGNNGVIPLRWSYPATEQANNAANWKAALANQGFASDDLNETMWLIK